ncbi:MAG: GNAT family N-acetyltransferase [Chloroflexi bacterium]|nr:GNAT family N-acetyltransferase [Chloroflexota bacterium]
MSRLTLRKFTQADFAAYARIVRAARGPGARYTAADAKDYLGQPNLRPRRDCFLAMNVGRAGGYALVVPELPIGRAVIEWGAAPAEARVTAGEALLARCLAHAGGLGAKLAHVSAQGHDREAAALYKRLGFAQVKRQWQMRLDAARWKAPAKAKEGITVRRLQPGEEALVTGIQNRAFGGSWGFAPNVPEELRYRLRMRGSRVQDALILEVKGAPAAYCWTRVNKGKGGATGIIWMIGVDPAYRGQGLGRAMLEASIADLKRRGATAVELTVYADNAPAVELYKAVGFKRIYDIDWWEKRL